MKLIISLIGSSNVGKSTLFNRILNNNIAIVSNIKNTTRDRNYGTCVISNHKIKLIDTPGIILQNKKCNVINNKIYEQTKLAIAESDIIFFIVNAKNKLTFQDIKIAKTLRKSSKEIFLIVNHVDKVDINSISSYFFSLGFNQTHFISAKKGIGIKILLNICLKQIHKYIDIKNKKNKENIDNVKKEEITKNKITIGVIGKPNVGKSTFINKIINENRLITSNIPETTRDSIHVLFQYKKKYYSIFDTAGIRKKKINMNSIEKVSVQKTIQTVKKCELILLIFNSQEEISKQDLTILRKIEELEKSIIIIINKWDLVDKKNKKKIRNNIISKIKFIKFFDIHFISCLKNLNINKIFQSIEKTHHSLQLKFNSSFLTNILHKIIKKHKPPIQKGQRSKLKFAHPEKNKNIFKNSQIIVIHGNKLNYIDNTYKKYLLNSFKELLNLTGVHLKIIFRETKNPYVK
ncbi:ribosome biogenesis GTPase Der [Buchnera aphidicola (Kurisakia onigurumii)]|uniref:ribosome biogenesis GTPase Der n=1 Tax=Buchnera aphidicola TaxID=9 RepID=UPI0031B6C2D6